LKIIVILFIITMNIRSLSNQLTIVIPSKNEGRTLYDCLYNISRQKHISGVRIIIADISDKEESLQYIRRLQTDFKYSLKIDVIKGGYPSEGRLNGSLLVKTPYMLFLDADVFLTNPNILIECTRYKKDLVTVPFYTDYPYGWVFRLFDMFQSISTLLKTPFAVGGFQLWKTQSYWIHGGYNPEELFAEDYSLSQKVDPKEFKVVHIKGTYTSSRRFKNKGVLWMFKIMIKSYINRKNPEFFKHHHGYWE
jgi:glycosyltransferase involved in cell wall biosynthesis